MNPKDLAGLTRVPLDLLPAVASAWQAMAHLDGASKYGPFNWRNEKIEAMKYVAAIKRHLDDWVEGETFSHDANVHHLGHLMASAAILMDAEAHGTLIDNRPKGNVLPVLHRILSEGMKSGDFPSVEAPGETKAH